MGSPKIGLGRFPSDGPRHEEAIDPGFWMFDTPCTQSLWQEVMGENPSHFQGADRPVENVSWGDCRVFIQRLNHRMNGLGLALPSEAQWECACRAGTETTRYRENLDEIAWYSNNAGDQTHPVAHKAPNSWGLYDTLGNVWESCADGWTDDYSRRLGKGAAAPKSADRVIRGGSWLDDAWLVRAASRVRVGPGARGGHLGFRCGEFKAQGPVDRAPASGTAWLRPGGCDEDSVSIPVMTPIRARSDIEALTIRPVSALPWASAIGRDRYGLWAEFTIDPPIQKKPRGLGRFLGRGGQTPEFALALLRQRLRWIPPGQFLMGSPEDEEGRSHFEGPRHQVRIDSGFWMFDAPCSQAMWEVVMGTNPSHFKGPDRPVERASWYHCQGFVTRLNDLIEGLHLSLPSEAQWEYACRAGTTAARYHEDLDQIAWYYTNSGGETHPVRGKAPNAWGLYDMLGNVWERCADAWRSDYNEKVASDSAEQESAGRVVRGGSWHHVAPYVRAAHRILAPPYLDDGLGFRCAEFRAGV
jgi:formylglycine-generating enzyme required for sulfatase activity